MAKRGSDCLHLNGESKGWSSSSKEAMHKDRKPSQQRPLAYVDVGGQIAEFPGPPKGGKKFEVKKLAEVPEFLFVC